MFTGLRLSICDFVLFCIYGVIGMSSDDLQLISHDSNNNPFCFLSFVNKLIKDLTRDLGKENIFDLEKKASNKDEVNIISGIIDRLVKHCRKTNFPSILSSIAKYLGHPNQEVVSIAAGAIALIVEQVVVDALTNPNFSSGTRLNLAKEFIKIFEEQLLPFLGIFDLGSRQTIESTLKLAISIVQEEELKKLQSRKENKTDEFVDSKIKESMKNLIGDITPEEYVNSVRQIGKNMVGNITPKEYVEHLIQSGRNLTGDISHDEFVGSLGQIRGELTGNIEGIIPAD